MAVALDTTSYHAPAAGTSYTVSHTNTGSEVGVLVAIYQFGAGQGGSDRISSATYGGITLTKLRAQVETLNGLRLQLMGGVGVPSGAQNLVVNMTVSTTSTIHIATYTGVDQLDPWQGANGTTATQTATSIAVSVTTDVDNSWVAGAAWENASGTMTAGANTTIQNSQSSHAWADTNGPESPTGAYSLNWDVTGTSPRLTAVAIGIQPSAGGAPNPRRLMMMGVGT